ncbi:Nuclear transport factor 2 [Platanthera guangdongensis]|uniref:Nuclear transport factor 2 n=1 Tax=Platanthera guangdongensis TaxID=2320717 RepID=A0ABR2MYC9_9ASPA
MDPDAAARAFLEHYYRTFDTNRAALGGLYQDNSILSFEGAKMQGTAAISEKLTGLPFQQCQHNLSTIDCQPSGPASGVLVFVSCSLQLSGKQQALKFSQMFHLIPTV